MLDGVSTEQDPGKLLAIAKDRQVLESFRSTKVPDFESSGPPVREPLFGLASERTESAADYLLQRLSQGGRTLLTPPGIMRQAIGFWLEFISSLSAGKPPDVIEVVVVPDIVTNVTVAEPLVMYFPLSQQPGGTSVTVTMRASVDAGGARREAMAVIRRIDGVVSAGPMLTMDERTGRQMSAQRFGAVVLGGLGIIALLLTELGTYVGGGIDGGPPDPGDGDSHGTRRTRRAARGDGACRNRSARGPGPDRRSGAGLDGREYTSCVSVQGRAARPDRARRRRRADSDAGARRLLTPGAAGRARRPRARPEGKLSIRDGEPLVARPLVDREVAIERDDSWFVRLRTHIPRPLPRFQSAPSRDER